MTPRDRLLLLALERVLAPVALALWWQLSDEARREVMGRVQCRLVWTAGYGWRWRDARWR